MRLDSSIWNDGTKSEEELAVALILKAQKNDHTKFELLRNLDDKFMAKTCVKIFAKLSKRYKKVSKVLLKQYLQTVKVGRSSHELIVAYQEMNLCSKFYAEEVNIYWDMLDEFKSYLWSGHFLDVYLFGNDRTNEDMVDMRGKVHEDSNS